MQTRQGVSYQVDERQAGPKKGGKKEHSEPQTNKQTEIALVSYIVSEI